MRLVDEIKFDEKGLVPAIIQDYKNNEVLMLGYMNREAVSKTLESGKVHFWSRSRGKMWVKGEISGHTQRVMDIFFDCDMDTILVKVDQKVAACHTGYRSCFYRTVKGDDLIICGEKVFEEKEVY
ncbi:MAG: phosphoribosyl-AMP cyclohydrolase [Deltaproteobacteria bacterium CG12_big_fil_rev_8_21_14_0_65_43_10]|nr:MAG: phosphoribosyl-AMP cyclohydrolase [Deltaproteobacteria bacterium CG2_30_43_15]PIQ46585.1 MAG: phosphoribosyl-AMP cyclohydrolase [Deltaproteobacteria bacterium CG12_big_fil_rev_8_21_14_0_65_43_10]PIU86201.1 MAG: phosphoribosyl-AMP cyclohydrolase [Deltaproteobacteria bacterium CG06_land_8_20_14_3_00_44_19]PIX24101.1 MAG: phosphoribosyl-AMP cyclohydrolase [Deltaproteobacteria bacterium CG_4_8_14_3_um_filter_43_13]PIZ19396.1 MAG: phosphoribosyl-AMP cyclohydrolase [Deltaproteobacteria bacter